jgi:hypothetical protein
MIKNVKFIPRSPQAVEFSQLPIGTLFATLYCNGAPDRSLIWVKVSPTDSVRIWDTRFPISHKYVDINPDRMCLKAEIESLVVKE